MNSFKDIKNTYIYDGSIEGLFTIIYFVCKTKLIPKNITTIERYQPNLFDKKREFVTSFEKSEFINKKIINISDYSVYLIYTAFLSNSEDKEMIILEYFVNLCVSGSKLNNMKNLECIINIDGLCKKVQIETHRFNGFLRFKELPNKVLYACFEPDNNIIEHLVHHFSRRLSNEHFVIYDKVRGIIATYNTKDCKYFTDDEIDMKMLDELSKDDTYETMWTKYFNTIAIKERTNRRCQLNFMPKKYWKNMVEMEGKS